MTIDREVFKAMCQNAQIGSQLRIRLPVRPVQRPAIPKPDEKSVRITGFDPALPGSDKTALVIYDVYKDEARPATQADIDGLQVRVNELFKQVCDQQWAVHEELNALRRMIENANDGKPLWFQKPIKGDVLSGHQWSGSDWVKLQMVEASPEIDHIWNAVQACGSGR